MTAETPAMSGSRARTNRVRWWWRRRMGWPGAVAVLLLLASAALSWVVRPTIASSQRDMLRAHVARLDAAARLREAGPVAGERDPRDAVRDALPMASRRAESIATLLALLAKAKATADRAEYVAEAENPGLVRVRVTLPIEGSYGSARELIASILNTLPHAALDSVELERPADAGDHLTGQLRLSLFFRREAP
jgi:hypothetical protein